MDKIKAQCLSFTPVSSRVTCSPAPTDTDADYLLLVKNHYEFRAWLLATYAEFVMDGSEIADANVSLADDDRFSSYSMGTVNLIVTQDDAFHQKFLAATSVAKRLNLLDKADRIALFQAVLYANPCDSI